MKLNEEEILMPFHWRQWSENQRLRYCQDAIEIVNANYCPADLCSQMNKLIESMDSEVDQQPLTTHATRILIPNHPMPSHWRHWNSDQKEKYCSAAIDILGHRDAIEALYRLHRSESGSDGVYQFMAELLDMQLDGVGDEFTLNHYASVILKFAESRYDVSETSETV